MTRRHLTILCILFLWTAGAGVAQAQPTEGQVQLPLEAYQELLRAVTTATEPGLHPPMGYAAHQAELTVTVIEIEGRHHANISATLPIQVLENRWVAIPLLPVGTALTSATVQGRPMALIPTPGGLMWATDVAGSYTVNLQYRVEALRFPSGHTVAIPLPPSASNHLSATLPGTGLAASIVPATSTQVTEQGGNTLLDAIVPGTPAIQLTWQSAGDEAFAVSRALYRGELVDEAVTWSVDYEVEVRGEEPVELGLLRDTVALVSMQVDGVDTPITVKEGRLVVRLEGSGSHTVSARFQVPLLEDQASPRCVLDVPRVPVSRFELTLPGEKEVTVHPVANVLHTSQEGFTLAAVHVPMTDQVSFSWVEAVPLGEEEVTEVRSNASLYHILYAEEGVLYGHAVVVFEVTRGETSQFELAVPAGALINRIGSPAGEVVDWRQSAEGAGHISVFLDRRVTGEFRFDVHYEKPLPTGEQAAQEFDVPLLSAPNVTRQRGMVALLSSRELALEPRREVSVNRVGENQLPAFIRDTIDLTVAHTFRYFEPTAELAVRLTVPERRQGRFDAQVDTLVSLGDVTTLGSATVDINVKWGSIMELNLLLPTGVNFLSLSAPSLRTHEIVPGENEQVIQVAFTQEMEGQFRVEVNYERINTEDQGEVPIPLLRVEGAEVEQGRVAIEALSAVEVQPSRTQNLSTVDVNELPQQLILRTTNPILLAFKYVQSVPTPELALRITHHREIEVQAAAIDTASYRTLITRDGFAVTTATFIVRNSRQQFLRVHLPEGAEVWSTFVNGQPEAPALASSSEPEGPAEVLINIINSAQGFPVEIVYANRLQELGSHGKIDLTLPTPDMVVTQTTWDLYLPDHLRYGEPEGDLVLVESAIPFAGPEASQDLGRSRAAASAVQPIQIRVPESGLRFRFEKLYANQAGREIGVSIPYTSGGGITFGYLLGILGTLMFWVGLAGLWVLRKGTVRSILAVLAAVGGAMVVMVWANLPLSPMPFVVLSIVMIALLFVLILLGRMRGPRESGKTAG
ncbi:MAG: hypothetical protein JW797_03125 [Bradymonadales bacterium]|nr:hypothetical protein [Bradymonadales bacterium]